MAPTITDKEAQRLLNQINYLAYKVHRQASDTFKEKCDFNLSGGTVGDSEGNIEIETVFLKFSFHYGQTNNRQTDI